MDPSERKSQHREALFVVISFEWSTAREGGLLTTQSLWCLTCLKPPGSLATALAWSCGSLWVWSNVILFFFYSCSTILPQVFLGLPLFPFLSGVQPRVIFSTASFYIWFTWPIHLQRLHLTSSSTGFPLAQLLKSSFDTLFGQEIQRICLKHLFLKVSSWWLRVSRVEQAVIDLNVKHCEMLSFGKPTMPERSSG